MELRGITKRFPGVVANHDVNLTVRRGTVHAIVGENGAGKSTLMKTLYGMHRPEEGTIRIDGEDAVIHSPSDAIARGIGMVHQHFQLADNLTVLENVVLGDEPTQRGLARLRRGAAQDPGDLRRVRPRGRRPTPWSRTSGSVTASGWRSSRSSTAAHAP